MSISVRQLRSMDGGLREAEIVDTLWIGLSGWKEEDHQGDGCVAVLKEDIQRTGVTEDAEDRVRWTQMIHSNPL